MNQNFDRWTQYFDRWEAEIAQAMESLNSPLAEVKMPVWEEPTDLGPLPPQLQDRAVALQRSLQDLYNKTNAAVEDLRRQRRAVDNLASQPATETAPLYLNVEG